ncbi:MAG: RNA methyltransferase [Gammaproteobacteria bacterium]|nr:RNA methyltransferase [Gammaproteobacteria bacterium]
MLTLNNVKVVLVNTSHPGNIGASARAMKNMGLSNLALVQPKDFPSGVAVGRAASAVDILESAEIFDSLEQAVSDCALVICASARSRKIPWPMLTPEESATKILKEVNANKVAIVFGREDAGLNNDELQLGHFHVQIPAEKNCSSLNLAAAVLVICYEIYKLSLRSISKELIKDQDHWDQKLATNGEVEYFYKHLERVMIAIDFHDPENPRQLIQRVRRLFNRIRIDVMEMNILRGILSNVENAINKKEN